MRSNLAGLRTLVLPWGAGPGTARIVIGPDLPPPLDTYLYKGVSRFSGAILFRQEFEDEFLFIGLLSHPTDGLVIILGGVRDSLVVEDSPGIPSGATWFFTVDDFVGYRHLGGSVSVPNIHIEGDAAFLTLTRADGTFWSLQSSWFVKSGPLGDAVARWILQSDGNMFWGDGQVTADCFIQRSSAETLLIGPDISIPGGVNCNRMRFKEDGRVGVDSTAPGTTPTALTITNGMTFIAPPSGIVETAVQAELRLELTSTAARVFYMGYEMRPGGTIGSGTPIVQPTLDRHAAAIGLGGTGSGSTMRDHEYASSMTFGLTPGNTYNIRLMKWLSSAGGALTQIIDPRIILRPSP